MRKIGTYVVVGVLLLSAGLVRADIVNGSFDSGDNFWMMLPSGTAQYQIVSYGGDDSVLQMQASNQWGYDAENGWVNLDGDFNYSSMTALNMVAMDDGLYAPVGTTALTFSAAFIESFSQSVEATLPTVDVFVNFWTAEGGDVAGVALDAAGESMATYTVQLPQIDVSQDITITIRAISDFEPSGEDPGQVVTLGVTAYFDNLQFTPEPATMLLLLPGLAMLRRRK